MNYIHYSSMYSCLFIIFIEIKYYNHLNIGVFLNIVMFIYDYSLCYCTAFRSLDIPFRLLKQYIILMKSVNNPPHLPVFIYEFK